LLEYKEIGKLRSSFTQKLPREVKYDGKIHPWHNTWGAATGRFTCKDPNTQQIPAKRPEIRHLFLATGPDRILVSIDYSQIELRVLAHMANETVLIEAFEKGRDIHSTTAALISGYTYEEIEANKDADGSPHQKYRKQAKIVNFGIVYGMGAGKLADTLEVSKNEAQKIIDDYFKGYPGIKRYMDEQHAKVNEARIRNGYIRAKETVAFRSEVERTMESIWSAKAGRKLSDPSECWFDTEEGNRRLATGATESTTRLSCYRFMTN
jgi:DNA polymerase-1